MSTPTAAELIDHMREAVEQATVYIEGMARADFVSDKRTQQAVILNLIILGEAATKLMDHHQEFAAAHPEIEWRSMRGIRNRIAHGYNDIDLNIVWDTATTALPHLHAVLKTLGPTGGAI